MFQRVLAAVVFSVAALAAACSGSSNDPKTADDGGTTTDDGGSTTTTTGKTRSTAAIISKQGLCFIKIDSAKVKNEDALFVVGVAVDNGAVTHAEYQVVGKTFEVSGSRDDGHERLTEGEWTTITVYKAPMPGDDDLETFDFRIKITGDEFEVKETKEKGSCKWN
ncbi:MAG: hypothetical protein U0271_26160 [Polyangiaceae bacterium]